ncbi:hypothetical protein B0H13DRAFT_1864516 [Mycena leptocephala]|nr:hypothetical protein B0H13DRAFT_1864516 [Mycena leptocephala]
MSQQAGLAGGPPPPGASPRRSHISLDVLEAFLESHAAQEPSAAVPEEARPRRSSRKTKPTSPPAPILPPTRRSSTRLTRPRRRRVRSAKKPLIGPPHRSRSRQTSKEKQSAFLTLKDSALAATSLDDLAAAFRDLVTLIRDHRKSAPTTACLDTLNAFQSRLDAHHEFPREDETADSFSALLTKSVTAPIQILTAQLQAQHQAIQSLTKSVDSTKTAHIFSKSGAPTPGPTPLLVPKPKPVPITSTPDERILLRCDGLAPPAFSLPYHELVPKLNGRRWTVLGPGVQGGGTYSRGCLVYLGS